MECEFGPFFANLTLVSAVDATNRTGLRGMLGPRQVSARISKYVSSKPSEGTHRRFSYAELGCTLSHLVTIRRAYLEGHELALILEDDIAAILM